MGTMKDDALDLAAKLAAAHAAGDTPELGELHDSARRFLYRHGEAAGLTRDDIAEIDSHGIQARSGTPKGPPPETGGDE